VRASIRSEGLIQIFKSDCDGWQTSTAGCLTSSLTSFYTESLQLTAFQRFALPFHGFSAKIASY
jgi:hypothetical protein